MQAKVSQNNPERGTNNQKVSEVFTALRVNRSSNQIERSTIAPYSLFTQLSPECQTTSTLILSLLPPAMTDTVEK